MAATTTITVTCPKCRKTLQAPANLQGKKAKCKGCGELFTIQQDTVKVVAPKKDAKPPEAPAAGPAPGKDEEWAKVVLGYQVTAQDDKPRCPFCAGELESDKDVLCLHCGYNLRTRERTTPKILEPLTFMDWFLWLGPASICGLLCLAILGLTVDLWIGKLPFGDWYGEWMQGWMWGQIYGSALYLAVAWFLGRFAFKRLVLHFRPPEREKKVQSEGND